MYVCVRDHLEELLEMLERHKELNSAGHFYKVRALDREPGFEDLPPVERAARIIYLNKTCYNGLYRVNSAGQFNSPYGKYKNPAIVNEPVVRAMSTYLNGGVKILCGDYGQALKGLRKGAFVYLDPPYMPISSSSSFTGYTEGGFGYDEQVRLKEECDKLASKGVHFIQSNSDCPEIRALYSDYEILTVKAKRAINSRGNRRGEINEVLIRG